MKKRNFAAPSARLSIAAIFLLGSISGLSPADAGTRSSTLFGTQERRSTNINLFPKWTSTLNRHARLVSSTKASCRYGNESACQLGRWTQTLKSLRTRDRMGKLREVNRLVNRVRYADDKRAYG
ncbi:MAG: hypothetical protein ACR2OX_07635, partial [Methyloligellaceae bacterium]